MFTHSRSIFVSADSDLCGKRKTFSGRRVESHEAPIKTSFCFNIFVCLDSQFPFSFRTIRIFIRRPVLCQFISTVFRRVDNKKKIISRSTRAFERTFCFTFIQKLLIMKSASRHGWWCFVDGNPKHNRHEFLIHDTARAEMDGNNNQWAPFDESAKVPEISPEKPRNKVRNWIRRRKTLLESILLQMSGTNRFLIVSNWESSGKWVLQFLLGIQFA